MASNLLKAGHKVAAFDMSKEAIGQIAAQGATAAVSARAAAAGARVVVTMLPSNPHVRKVYCGEDGVLSDGGAGEGTLLIDCSTCEPSVSREVAGAAVARGAAFVDAPVSGGTIGAEEATLTFMVGGTEEAFRHAEKVLAHMGGRVVHCGEVGTGQVAKLCNNLLLGISMAGTCEAYALGERLGLDPRKLAEIVNTSSGRCWSSDTYNPCPGVMEGVPSARGYTGGFATHLMVKDLGLAMAAASGARLGLPLGGLVQQLYSVMGSHGGNYKDFSAMYEFVADKESKK